MSKSIRQYVRPFKIVFLGDTCVGKSCLVVRYIHDEYSDSQTPTIGSAFHSYTGIVNDIRLRFEIWDTAGQERYRSLAPLYYRGAAAAVVVYDITNFDSYINARRWVESLKQAEAVGNVCSDIIIALVGNKVDLSNRRVTTEEATKYALEKKIIFLETSAKDSLNVNEIFSEIVKKVPVTATNPINVTQISLTHKPTLYSYCC